MVRAVDVDAIVHCRQKLTGFKSAWNVAAKKDPVRSLEPKRTSRFSQPLDETK
jgi:hypothetical protein